MYILGGISRPRPVAWPQRVLPQIWSVTGYLDIIPGDFKELYRIAYRHAAERFARSMPTRIRLIVALIVNNIPKTGRYPEFWI